MNQTRKVSWSFSESIFETAHGKSLAPAGFQSIDPCIGTIEGTEPGDGIGLGTGPEKTIVTHHGKASVGVPVTAR